MRPLTRARASLLVLLLAVLGLSLGPPPALAPQASARAEPLVAAASLNAGCIQVSPTVCKLHIDPFTLEITPGERLEAFQLQANGQVMYDFRADVSNPPSGSYTPSAVKRDFGVACGQTYTVNLVARDTGDVAFVNAGRAQNVACAAAVYTVSLPIAVFQAP